MVKSEARAQKKQVHKFTKHTSMVECACKQAAVCVTQVPPAQLSKSGFDLQSDIYKNLQINKASTCQSVENHLHAEHCTEIHAS